MHLSRKIFLLVFSVVCIVAISVEATLGIQNWQKNQPEKKAAQNTAKPQQNTVPKPQLAQVTGVVPHFVTAHKKVKHCYPVQHTRYVSTQRNPPVVGGAIGGVVGGLIGSKIGKGHGRDVAIASGAVLGALTGSRIANQANQPRPEVSESWHCTYHTVKTRVQKGYEVTYLYQNKQGVTIMSKAPPLYARIPPPTSISGS